MATTRWLDEDEAHLWRTWLRLNQELPSVLEAQISRDSGLSGADYAVLVPLSESPEGTRRARELGRQLLWDRSRSSHHVRRMDARGLVVREGCAEDARGAMVRITDAGRAAITGAAPGHVAATRRYFFDLLADHARESRYPDAHIGYPAARSARLTPTSPCWSASPAASGR